MKELFYAILYLASVYAIVRLLCVIPSRMKYNKTHREKVWLVSMGDVPYFTVEFFCLPYLAVRGLWRKAEPTGESANLPEKACADYVAEKAALVAPRAESESLITLARKGAAAERAAEAALASNEAGPKPGGDSATALARKARWAMKAAKAANAALEAAPTAGSESLIAIARKAAAAERTAEAADAAYEAAVAAPTAGSVNLTALARKARSAMKAAKAAKEAFDDALAASKMAAAAEQTERSTPRGA